MAKGYLPIGLNFAVEGVAFFEEDVAIEGIVPWEGNAHVIDVVEDVLEEENEKLGPFLEPMERKVSSSEQILYPHIGML